jgi:cell division protein ZapA
MSDSEVKSIRVRILDREYPLKVDVRHEEFTRRVAAYVDRRMEKVRKSLPDQHETTAAVIAALSIAEELFAAREAREKVVPELQGSPEELDGELRRLESLLGAALETD